MKNDVTYEVLVVGASKVNIWYSNKIGKTFICKRELYKSGYIYKPSILHHIYPEDCVVIQKILTEKYQR